MTFEINYPITIKSYGDRHFVMVSYDGTQHVITKEYSYATFFPLDKGRFENYKSERSLK